MRLFEVRWVVLAIGATIVAAAAAQNPAPPVRPAIDDSVLPSSGVGANPVGRMPSAVRLRSSVGHAPVSPVEFPVSQAMHSTAVEPARFAGGIGSDADLADGVASAAETSPRGPPDSLPLSRPSKVAGERDRRSPAPSTGKAITTVLGSLAVVLGLFLLVVWFARRALPRASTSLPKDVVELLGKAPLGQRQQMQLVRVGNKLLLLSVTPNGTDTLTEICDPVEVDRITGLCHQNQSGSITESFRQILAGVNDESSPDDAADDESTRPWEMALNRPQPVGQSVELKRTS